MLYVFDGIDALDDFFPERFASLLSAERIEKVSALRFLIDKKLSVCAYLLLRHALKVNYGIDENVVFAYSETGKPSLRDYPHIHFNLSHCRNAAACALSDTAVGVDVQDITNVSNELAARVLTAKEYADYKVSPCPHEFFCRLWTMKESQLKKTGQGIGLDLTAVPAGTGNEQTVYRFKNCYCCVAGTIMPFRLSQLCDFENMLSGG